MSDMLVKLYDLPEINFNQEKFKNEGIDFRRAMTPDKWRVLQFVEKNFGKGWASECDASFSNKPVSCFIAVKTKLEIIGFACYEATNKCFFGPTGILKEYRGKGIGKELLLRSLNGLREIGYAYAIIGGPSEAIDFYKNVCGASVIPESNPSIYKDMIGL